MSSETSPFFITTCVRTRGKNSKKKKKEMSCETGGRLEREGGEGRKRIEGEGKEERKEGRKGGRKEGKKRRKEERKGRRKGREGRGKGKKEKALVPCSGKLFLS